MPTANKLVRYIAGLTSVTRSVDVALSRRYAAVEADTHHPIGLLLLLQPYCLCNRNAACLASSALLLPLTDLRKHLITIQMSVGL